MIEVEKSGKEKKGKKKVGSKSSSAIYPSEMYNTMCEKLYKNFKYF